MKTLLGVALLGLVACLSLLALAASCSPSHSGAPAAVSVRGPDTPRFSSAATLLAAARSKGISCTRERPFDPAQNIARDAIDYPVPDGRACLLTAGVALYFIVYDSLPHRMQAVDKGETQRNLCELPPVAHRSTESWHALVAANWRIATPGAQQTLAALRVALGGTAEPEVLSCQFRN